MSLALPCCLMSFLFLCLNKLQVYGQWDTKERKANHLQIQPGHPQHSGFCHTSFHPPDPTHLPKYCCLQYMVIVPDASNSVTLNSRSCSIFRRGHSLTIRSQASSFHPNRGCPKPSAGFECCCVCHLAAVSNTGWAESNSIGETALNRTAFPAVPVSSLNQDPSLSFRSNAKWFCAEDS